MSPAGPAVAGLLSGWPRRVSLNSNSHFSYLIATHIRLCVVLEPAHALASNMETPVDIHSHHVDEDDDDNLAFK